jgi:glycine cleavage system H lipoate-binding protein
MPTVIESVLVFALGLLARLALLALVVFVLALPILVVLDAWGRLEPLRARLRGFAKVRGLVFQRRVSYAPGHTWLAREAGEVKVGLDDLAHRLFGDVDRVALPAVGARVREGDTVAEVAAGPRQATIPSPLAGVVTRVNAELSQDPARLGRDPYRAGWLLAVRADDERWLGLRRGREARRWFEAEARRLTRRLEGELGLAAADGGDPLVHGPAHLDGERWKTLARSFLHAA